MIQNAVIMKRALKLFLIILAVSGASAFGADNAKPQRGTMEYYLQAPDRYLDKSVSIFITHARPINSKAPKDYTAFSANTASRNNAFSGDAIIYVRTLRADAFAKKYAQGWIVNGVPQTTQISGKFVKALEPDGSYAIMMN